MKITGGHIIKVSAEKLKDVPNQGMNVNIAINNVKIEKDKINVNYTYTVTYLPEMAVINITGEMTATENEKTAKELLDKWTATKVIPESLASDIVTSVTYTGSAIGTLLAFALGVPAPINIQKAKISPNKPTEQKAA